MAISNPQWKRRTIRNYHLESDIFFKKPLIEKKRNIPYFYESDIFNLKEERNKKPLKNIKTGRCFLESGPEKERRPLKAVKVELYKETTQKDWIVTRMKPDIRKCDEDNTLAYDLTKEKPKIERNKKRRIASPKAKNVVRGKKILVDKIRENPRNTLAFH